MASILMALGLAAASLVPLTEGDSQGYVLFLDIGGDPIRVRLDSQSPSYFLDPVTGQQLPRYTVADGLRIAEALERTGHADQLFPLLLGERFGPARSAVGPDPRRPEPHLLFLEIQGAVVHVPLDGDLEGYVLDPWSGARMRRFTVADAQAIQTALEANGFLLEDVLRAVLTLHVPFRAPRPEIAPGRFQPNAAEARQVLPSPPCGECMNGIICHLNGSIDCCSGSAGQGCQKCSMCES